MLFKLIIICITVFPLISHSSGLQNCEYTSFQVLKINGTDGAATCKPTKLCSAEILCTKTIKDREVEVKRKIVCELDDSANCPPVETCLAERTTASFETEGMTGTVGETTWLSVMGKAHLDMLKYYHTGKLHDAMNESNTREIKYNDHPKEAEGVK